MTDSFDLSAPMDPMAMWRCRISHNSSQTLASIEHVGFKVENVDAVKKELAALRESDAEMRERIIAEPERRRAAYCVDRRLPPLSACDFESGWGVCRYLRVRARDENSTGLRQGRSREYQINKAWHYGSNNMAGHSMLVVDVA